MPSEYTPDLILWRKPPKAVQRPFGPAFPGGFTLVFRWPVKGLPDGSMSGFGITTTKSDSGTLEGGVK